MPPEPIRVLRATVRQSVHEFPAALEDLDRAVSEAPQDGQAWLINANIPEFSHGNRFNHEPKRPRNLLLHEREIEKIHVGVSREGMTLIPMSIYFNGRGRAKVELALAKGKKLHDKRETVKERDWKRDQQRLLRERG